MRESNIFMNKGGRLEITKGRSVQKNTAEENTKANKVKTK